MKEKEMMGNQEVKKTRRKVKKRSQNLKLTLVGLCSQKKL
jgi:hypothetical protein